MATLGDGARAVVQGSGANRYTLEHKGDVYSCTCPAWRNQSVRIEQRTCKHLRAYLGDALETARIGTAVAAPRDSRIKARRVNRFIEDRELRAERLAALDRAVERAPVLDDRMQAVYGLRLPRHLAFAIGFWMGLTTPERREAWAYLGTGPIGVGAWFLDSAQELRVRPGLDERLEYRFRRDPPEMVSVFSSNSDGGHWGLWYDDPKELPSTVVMNYARDSGETWACKRTLLESLRESVAGREDESSFVPEEWPHRTAILDWLDLVLEREIDARDEQAIRLMGRRPTVIGGMGSIDPAWVLPTELEGHAAEQARSDAYKDRAPIVSEWIALARKELAEGSAGRALFLGRELHWVDADEWRKECTELLVGAYALLDRLALGEIVKVHHQHRDLPSVGVYAPAEPTAFELAVAAGDGAVLRADFAGYLPSASELAAVLGATSMDVLDFVLGLPGADRGADAAAYQHLLELQEATAGNHAEHPSLRELADLRGGAVIRIFERHGARGKAFAMALAFDADIRATAIAHADLTWRSPRGRSVLHVAAAASSLEAVRALLDRGIDPLLRDQDGETAFDATRTGRERNPREATAIFELLEGRGGGPPKPPLPPADDWPPGTCVLHKQFGAGVVEAVSGTGDKAKLTIKFANATKVLVSAFVTRE